MKIYNKKLFVFGIFSIALATLNFIMDVINKTSDVNGAILVGALYLIGFEAMLHSLSRKLSKQDKLENLDERNRVNPKFCVNSNSGVNRAKFICGGSW